MAEVQLNKQDSLRLLNSTEASSDSRVIAACALAFFESTDSEALDGKTKAIAQKLLRMAAAALDEIDVAEDGEVTND